MHLITHVQSRATLLYPFGCHSGSSSLVSTAKPGRPAPDVRTTLPRERNFKPTPSASLKPGRSTSSQTSSPTVGQDEDEQSTKMPDSLTSRVSPTTSRSASASRQRILTGTVRLNRGCALREGTSLVRSIDKMPQAIASSLPFEQRGKG